MSVVGVGRLAGWGPRDPACAWLETLQEMAANRCSNNYDPNKVLETIDAVLAKETADDNVSGVLAVEAPSSGQTTCVLDRMIAAKQREVELEMAGSTKINQPRSRPTTRAHPQRTTIKQREVELMEYQLVPALVTIPAAPLPASR
ncbi:hypothetical protein CLF_101050 [Clonorchis sinensis]|uniref:Uncharacterized protein n=1 Tax=Clonorchis sinensis TaxID=79923 RepID=G7Y4V1_CLOSI|nr:hypothetical protein CLF_101050 [Clonorchis sinensis]